MTHTPKELFVDDLLGICKEFVAFLDEWYSLSGEWYADIEEDRKLLDIGYKAKSLIAKAKDIS